MAQDPEATRANSVASASSPGASTWNGGSAWPALFEPQHLSSPSGSTAHACCASDALTCRNWWFFGARHWPCRPTERERGVNRRPRQRLQPTNRTRTLLPQQRAVLSRCSAQVCESPALTWRMPCVPDGTLLCPWGLLPAGAGAWARRGRRKRGCRVVDPPKQKRVPSWRRAQPWVVPLETWTKGPGLSMRMAPQHTRDWSTLRAHAWFPPAVTCANSPCGCRSRGRGVTGGQRGRRRG